MNDTTPIQRALIGTLADEFTDRALFWKAKAAGVERYLTDPASVAGWNHFSESGEFDLPTFQHKHPEHSVALALAQQYAAHAYNVDSWIDAIRQAWKTRELRKALLTALDEPCWQAIETIAGAVETLQGLRGPDDPEAEIQAAIAEVEARAAGRMPETVIGWGIQFLDRDLGPLGKHEFVVLGARPSHGKTSLLAQSATGIADTGKPVSFFSLEMGRAEILHRLTAARLGFNKAHLGPLHRDRNEKYRTTLEGIARNGNLLLHFDKSGIDEILATAALDVRGKGAVAVFVDYLQLIEVAGKGAARVEEISKITRRLKQFAMRHAAPVIVGSQLNRLSEAESRPPRLSDLRESGSIEQDADRCILLHDAQDGTTLLIQAKNRGGPTGSVKATFNRTTTSFHPIA